MQPVQDLTIDATISRAQYQFVLEDAEPARVRHLGAAAGRAPAAAAAARRRGERPAAAGLAAYIIIDRATAARFGITPATVDNALYDAFGQRIISTIFTQSNQYRVILEADPSMQQSLDALRIRSTCRRPRRPAARCRCRPSRHVDERPAPLQITHLGQFPATTISFNLAPGASLGEAVDAIEQAETEIGLPASFVTALPGRRARVPVLARQRSCC